MTDNGDDALAVNASAVSFSFATSLAEGSEYSVAVHAQPTGQTCTVSNGSGSASGNVTNVAVNCTTNTFTVGGTVSGLSVTGLVLQDNNAGDDHLASGASLFSLPPLPTGSAYNVTIETQPSTQMCSVVNATGTVGNANVTSIVVNCVQTYTVGGTVSGLSGGSVVL